MTAQELALKWHDLFNHHAADLYPGRYTLAKCQELAEMALEIKALAKAKESVIVAHNYLYPEFHEIADLVGDSLALSLKIKERKAKRVDFESVYFMGATAKIITGDETRIFVPDKPEVIGCSLVFGTDHDWLLNWKKENPDGILITYINSDPFTKSISDFIATSRNMHKIIVEAAKIFPNRKMLLLPDKFLSFVMKARAVEQGVNPDLIEIYNVRKGEWRSACYVHEQIGPDAVEIAMIENSDAELMIHPECGCASSCMYKLQAGLIPQAKAYFLSTEQMVLHAKSSPAKKFIVATEKGMLYRLRKEIPGKIFLPVSMNAECRYMKENTFEKLLRSLKEDRLEIIFCNDCCDPKKPYQDERMIHIPKSVAEKSKIAIDRMMVIK